MRKGMAHLSAELAGPPLELRPKVLQQWDLFPGMMSSGPFPREEQSSNITQLLEWRWHKPGHDKGTLWFPFSFWPPAPICLPTFLPYLSLSSLPCSLLVWRIELEGWSMLGNTLPLSHTLGFPYVTKWQVLTVTCAQPFQGSWIPPSTKLPKRSHKQISHRLH